MLNYFQNNFKRILTAFVIMSAIVFILSSSLVPSHVSTIVSASVIAFFIILFPVLIFLFLEKSEIETAIDNSISGFLIVDDNDTVDYVNKYAHDMLGINESRVKNSILDFIPNFGDLKKNVKTKQEAFILKSDGSRIDVELMITEIHARRQSKLCISFHDISDRKKLEKYKSIQFKTTAAVSTADNIVKAGTEIISNICELMDWQYGEMWIVDDDKKLTQCTSWCNESVPDKAPIKEFEKVSSQFRFGRGEGLPGYVYVIEAPKWVEDVGNNNIYVFARKEQAKAAGLNSSWGIPIKHNGVSGVIIFYNPKMSKPEPIFIEIMTDICSQLALFMERKKSDQLAITGNKMAALGEMASGVAHEINSPLMVILNRAEQISKLVDKELLDKDKIKSSAEKITDMTTKIAKIIKGLRSFSRDGSRDPFLKTAVIDILNDTLELCKEKFSYESIKLDIDNKIGDFEVDCRQSQISQVLLNLISNAYDAIVPSPDKDKWVRIELLDFSNDLVEISVTDSGKGIPAEIQDKLMQPFFTTKEIGKGTGLGLSICRGIVLSHGGEIFIDNTSPNTKFVVRLKKRLEQEPL